MTTSPDGSSEPAGGQAATPSDEVADVSGDRVAKLAADEGATEPRSDQGPQTGHLRPAPVWRLRLLDDPVCIMHFDSDAAVPAWVWDAGPFVSVTRTDDELSVICSADVSGEADDVVGPYLAFKVDQQLDFGLTGVLAALLEPIEEAEISVLAMSTYDTDWILVPADESDDAIASWRRRGHTVC